MVMGLGLIEGRVMHARTRPQKNGFRYRVYYVSIPLTLLSQPQSLPLRWNQWGLHSLYARDHGYRDERSWQTWAHDVLAQHQQPLWPHITLLCMPRVAGYVFNPVSFWLCYDDLGQLKAIICEVNNTFGETHTYLCVPKQSDHIDSTESIYADKCFHVSPFITRDGYYQFRFDIQDTALHIDINYFNDADELVLKTSLEGDVTALTPKSLKNTFYRYPLVTLKAIALIHYQALKLWLKRVPFIKQPLQLDPRVTRSRNE